MRLAVQYSTFTAESMGAFVTEHYDLNTVVSCKLFKQALSDLYLLEADNRYIFRVWRRGLETSQLELRLSCAARVSKGCEFLNRVYPGNDGKFVQTLNAPEGKRTAALFEHISGQSGTRQLSEVQAAQIGEALAKLHSTSEHSSSNLPILDAEVLLEQPLEQILSFNRFSTNLKDRLRGQAARLRQKLSTLEPHLRRGYIHGDAHPVNVIFNEQKACFVDIDLFSVGWPAYDIGTFNWWVRSLENQSELYTAFITTYSEISK